VPGPAAGSSVPGAQAAPYDPAASSADPSVPPGPGPAAASAASPADDPAPGDRPDAGAADAAASYEPAGHPAVPEGDAPPGAAPGGEEQEGHEEHQAPDAVPAAEAADDSGDGRVNASGKAGGADGTEAADGAEAAGDAEAADGPDGGAVTAAPTRSEHPVASYTLRVNGTDRPVTDAWLGESLLYVLRERLGLAGAKDGCEQGECGACSVQVDGRLVASCLVPAATAAGSEVRTVEGLTVAGAPSDVQRALADCGAVQCGFCIPGLAMTVHDLLEGNHRPTDLEVRQAVSGNLCRCSGYRGVLDAVRQVVAERATDDDGPQKPVDGADPARVPHQGRPPSLPEAHG
jgi:aerobic-type carbon monoxide dehydrogenase small subunit (CoxS/CutS family)